MTSDDGGELSDQVARNILELRQSRGWTRKDLAERCKSVGAAEVTTTVLVNIESGRRDKHGRRTRKITIDEVAALARALDVPPVLLVYPLGKEPECVMATTERWNTWLAVRWFSGEGPDPVEPDGEREVGNPVLKLYRRHQAAIGAWKRALWDAKVAPLWGRVHEKDEAARQRVADALNQAEAAAMEIATARVTMAELGYPLPDLPTDFASPDAPVRKEE